MPELPEVETVARQLGPLLVGRRVEKFEVFDPLLNINEPERLAGRRIVSVARAGKQVLIGLGPAGDGEALWQQIHLRMTGRLLWDDNGAPMPHPPRPSPVRARWTLDRGGLFFHDTRRFGTIRLLASPAEAAPAGVDPMGPAFTDEWLRSALEGVKTPIKPWLLRQDRIVGIGNIYASEALFEAEIHPEQPAGAVRGAAIGRLREAIRTVLERAIAAGGTTFSDFQNARGDVGNYQKNLQVYDQNGEPCPRCGRTIERIVQQQRTTYYCPRCQPRPRRRRGS